MGVGGGGHEADEKTERVGDVMALEALDVLVRVIAQGAPLSAGLTHVAVARASCGSGLAFLHLARASPECGAIRTNKRSSHPAQKAGCTVDTGSKSFGESRHWRPVEIE